ncbi:MAG: hypothetical protein WCK17_11005 [Verrucomicrobiota bacterium]
MQPEEAINQSDARTQTPSATKLKADAKHKAEAQKGLTAIMEGLKKMGAVEAPPIADQLKYAITSGDGIKIRRAFHEALYGRFSKMSDSTPAMKSHLDSSDIYVQYLAAESLLKIGDQSGVEILLKTVQSDEAVSKGERDLRLAASTTLATFNVARAAGSIRELYSKTKEGEALDALVTLSSQASEANGWAYVSSRLAIESYAKTGSAKFTPQIAKTYDQSSDMKTKNAAAWALARMTGEERYINHLIAAARPVMEEKPTSGGQAFNDSAEALRYLGSLQSPAVKRVLEQALESQNPVAVSSATVNLLFNQSGESEKAKRVVIDQFEGKHQMLEWELAMQIASKLNDPRVKAAAQAFDQRTGGDRWRFWGVERSEWPIQNWVHDYVVKLK